MTRRVISALAACCALTALLAVADAQHPNHNDLPLRPAVQRTAPPAPQITNSDECNQSHGRAVPPWCRERGRIPPDTPRLPSVCDRTTGRVVPSWCTKLVQEALPTRPSRGRPDDCNPRRGYDLPPWCRDRLPSSQDLRRAAPSRDPCDPTLGRALPTWCGERRRPSPDLRNGPNAVLDDCHPSRGALTPAWCRDRPGRLPRWRRGATSPATTLLSDATTATAGPVDDDEYVPFAGRRLDAFDWRLVREMNELVSENAVVSPLGVKMVLGMLHEAASRASAQELRQALGLPAGRPSARDAFRRILQTLQEKHRGYVMRVGNRVYLDRSYVPRTGIVKTYGSHYNAQIEGVDFHNPSVVKPTINSWVSNLTNGLINQLITNDRQVQDLITMILNVIYFKGTWRYSFPRSKTTQGVFHVTAQKNSTVNYMHLKADLYYCASKKLDGKILRLPYEGKKYSMFLILPNKMENFNKMIQRITPELMREEFNSLTKMEVQVQLPKFKFDYTVHVKEVLQRLGLSRIFTHSDEINLTKNKTNFVISKIIQKVALDVNEEGTEATSVTVTELQNMFGGLNYFIATHPFLFFVEEEKTGTIVFVGKVIDPSFVKPLRPKLNTGSPIGIPASLILERDFSTDISAQTTGDHIPPVAPSS